MELQNTIDKHDEETLTLYKSLLFGLKDRQKYNLKLGIRSFGMELSLHLVWQARCTPLSL